jgi:catechol 2,3-dioxygenase-like lactoylglutathione lyase family enzyme
VFDHVTIRVSDRAASERFYRTVLSAVGMEPAYVDDEFVDWGQFSLAGASDERPVTRRLHIAFAVPTREAVHAFWRAGTEAGYRDDGAPGPRPQYGPDYYGGFLLDPDGNSAEAVTHDSPRRTMIDHLWIRVADVAAAKRFYETIAPHAGLRLGDDEPDRAQFVFDTDFSGGSFSLVSGAAPTEQVHLAFPAPRAGAVDAFHAAATAAGHRDNGAPGERPEYHPGYHAAFVLDPDGNNVEVVDHGRDGS